MSGNAWLHQLERDMPYKSQNSARAIMIDRWFCLGKISQFFVLLSLNAAGWIYSTQTMTAPAWKYQVWQRTSDAFSEPVMIPPHYRRVFFPCLCSININQPVCSFCSCYVHQHCKSTFSLPGRWGRLDPDVFFLTLRSLRLGLRWRFMCLGSDLDRDVPGQGSMS